MGSIRLVTEVPGPRSRELAARSSGSVGRPVMPGDVFVARGEGAVLEDVDGNRLIDLIGGLGCLVVGHSHPRVVEAVRSQAGLYLHTDFSVVGYDSYVTLAERLSEACGSGRKVGFFNSGAEAIENAVKVARAVTGRPGVACFEGGFHGRTYMAMTLTSRETPYKEGFGPFVPEVHRLPYPGFEGATLDGFEAAAGELFSERAIAAVVVEPVLGEGGFVVPPRGFLQAVERLCREHGAAFVADEIQSGYGRTGTFLASEQAGVRPDMVTLGKSIAAGLPLSAVAGDPAWLDALPSGALGGTYVGNPVACAAALAVLDVFEEEKLLQRAREVGERLTSAWEEIAARTAAIRAVRGVGAMVGVEFEDAGLLAGLLSGARSRGVLAITAGKERRVLRHLVPLVVTDEQLDEALGVFGDLLGA